MPLGIGIGLRVATAADAIAVADIYAPIVADTPISFETEPPAAEVMAARILEKLPTHPWLIAEQDGEVLGYAYGAPHRDRAAYRWSVDVSVYVREGLRGAGIGRGLYTPLVAILRQQGFRAAYAGITLPNAGSVGLHEAVGFRPLGIYKEVGFKCGRWHDVGWWRLALSEADGAPAEPLAFEAWRRSPEGRERLSALGIAT